MTRTNVKDVTFMAIAGILGTLGTCDRKLVGALIVRDGRCVSWGYNGAPPGMPHCEHLDDEPCTTSTHAEANALAFAARQGISTDGATLYVTVSPCATCSRLIIAAGIVRVWYNEPYREEDGCRILTEAKVPCERL